MEYGQVCLGVRADLRKRWQMVSAINRKQSLAVHHHVHPRGANGEGGGLAGRIEHGDVRYRVPDGTQKIGTLAVLHHVLRKLFDVEVVGDQVVDLAHFDAGELDHLPLNGRNGSRVGDASVRSGEAVEDMYAAFLGYAFEGEVGLVRRNLRLGCVPVPAEYLGEKGRKVEHFQAFYGGFTIKRHGLIAASYSCPPLALGGVNKLLG